MSNAPSQNYGMAFKSLIFTRSQPLLSKLLLSSNNLFILALLTIYASGLLVSGYYVDYSETAFQIYLPLTLAWGALWISWTLMKLSAIEALYSWLFFFLFFPKREIIGENIPVLFNTGFGLLHGSFSLYSVLELFISFALFLVLLRERFRPSQFNLKPAAYLFYIFTALFALGLAHITYIDHGLEKDALSSLIKLNTIFLSCIILIILTSYVKSTQQLEKILFLFILIGITLTLEYGLGRAEILPDFITYNSFSWRNSFRSILMSDDLMLGMIAICSAGASLFFYLKTKNIGFLALFFICNFLVLETFNRSQSFPILIAVLTICVMSRSWVKAAIYLFVVLALLHPLSLKMSTIQPQSSLSENTMTKYGWVGDYFKYEAPSHPGYNRPGGYLSPTSSLQRVGAFARATDTFIEHPLTGVGSANAVKAMISPKIPTHVALDWLPADALHFYSLIKSGTQPTNAHSYYFHMLSEYGVLAIALFLCLAYICISALIRSLMNPKAYSEPYLATYMVLLSFMLYFIFQATPLLMPLFMVFVCIHWHASPRTHTQNTL